MQQTVYYREKKYTHVEKRYYRSLVYVDVFNILLTARDCLTDFLVKVSLLCNCISIKSEDLYDKILLQFSMHLGDLSRNLLLRRGYQQLRKCLYVQNCSSFYYLQRVSIQLEFTNLSKLSQSIYSFQGSAIRDRLSGISNYRCNKNTEESLDYQLR